MPQQLIKNRIWRYRQLKELGQDELAFLLNDKESSQIARYERGERMPDPERLWKIARALEVGVGDLFPVLVDRWEGELSERSRLLEEGRKNKYERQNGNTVC